MKEGEGGAERLCKERSAVEMMLWVDVALMDGEMVQMSSEAARLGLA